MWKIELGQPILVGLILIALGIVAVDVCSLLSADLASGWAAHQLHGRFYHLAGPFHSMPYIGAAIMLPLVLVRRRAEARRAVAAIFGVFMACGILWWAFAAEIPHGAPTGEIVFARLCWFILLPVAYVAALYVPSITRYVTPSTEGRQSNEMMRKSKDRRSPILYGFLVFSVGTWVVHLWLILFAEAAERQAAYHVASPLLSMPYVFASILLPLILIRRVEPARKALAAVLGVFIVIGTLWWALAADVPWPPDGMIVLGRLSWLILLPLVWVAVLYLPTVTRFFNQTTRRGQRHDEEVSQ